jgi:hypothetical protein
MSLLSGLIRFLFVLLVVRLLGRFLAGVLRRPATPGAGPGAAADLVRDRVCNTFLPRERALKALVAGHEEHFCSQACRDRALAGVSRAC